MKQKILAWCLFVIASIAVTPAFAEQVLVAVAANFVPPFREIAMEFEKTTGHNVRVAAGSSGNFYAQIKNGAPSDVFFSADMERPKLLEDEGFGVTDSRFTYAIGRLVLWSPNADLVKGEETLRSKNLTRLSDLVRSIPKATDAVVVVLDRVNHALVKRVGREASRPGLPVYYRKRGRRSDVGTQPVPDSLYPFRFREDL